MTDTQVVFIVIGTIIYAGIAALIFWYGSDTRRGRNGLAPEPKRGARIMLLSPVWPVMIVIEIVSWLMEVIEDALGKGD